MRSLPFSYPRLPALLIAALALAAIVAPSASTTPPATERAVVGFHSDAELAEALRSFPGAKIVRRVPVKIIIDSGLDNDHGLPLGISVEPTVRVR